MTFPEFEKIAAAFGFAYRRTTDHADIHDAIRETLAAEGPAICEIMADKAQQFAPKLSSKKLDDGTMVTAPLEDMAPFLPREELEGNMLIPMQN